MEPDEIVGNSRESCENYIRDLVAEIDSNIDPKALSEACYTFAERHVFGDEEIRPDGALRIWAMVERVRRDRGFPEEMVM